MDAKKSTAVGQAQHRSRKTLRRIIPSPETRLRSNTFQVSFSARRSQRGNDQLPRSCSLWGKVQATRWTEYGSWFATIQQLSSRAWLGHKRQISKSCRGCPWPKTVRRCCRSLLRTCRELIATMIAMAGRPDVPTGCAFGRAGPPAEPFALTRPPAMPAARHCRNQEPSIRLRRDSRPITAVVEEVRA
jgi:hypothetical protein